MTNGDKAAVRELAFPAPLGVSFQHHCIDVSHLKRTVALSAVCEIAELALLRLA